MDNYPSQSLTDLDTTLSHDQVDTIIKEAFKVWSDVSSVTFTRIPPNSLDTADIHLLFGARQHSNVYQDPVFDGEGGTLAHAFSPNSGWGETNGDVHFDDDETFTHRVYRGIMEIPFKFVILFNLLDQIFGIDCCRLFMLHDIMFRLF